MSVYYWLQPEPFPGYNPAFDGLQSPNVYLCDRACLDDSSAGALRAAVREQDQEAIATICNPFLDEAEKEDLDMFFSAIADRKYVLYCE